jgi:hypothetical protein
VASRWREWRARRRRASRVERLAQHLIWLSGYDVKTKWQEEWFRAQARQVIADAEEDGG